MKNLIVSLIVITSLVFSQTDMYLIGGINYSKVVGDDVEDIDNTFGIKLGFEKKLSNIFIAGIGYSQRGWSSSSEEDGSYSWESKVNLNYLTTYVFYPYKIENRVDLLGGVELGYFINAKVKSEYCEDGDCESDTEEIDSEEWDDMDGNKFDYGLVVGGKYSINAQIALVGTYFFGLANLFDDNDADAKNRSLQLNIRYSL